MRPRTRDAGNMHRYPCSQLRISAIMIDQFGNVTTVIGIHDQWGSMAPCTQSGPLDFAC
jgi:hypothetical protein